ncbi:unnamed protein product [Rotaria socialis]|uniref:VWFA domain-containing protein n=1 Tax=Rotaria socialis TaxID=392032 RepID=A0A821JTD2_9BILA|nr:unnamed protein product [Rotaria socialis]
MSATTPFPPTLNTVDDCTICLNALAPGTALLTLSCSHQFHLQCLASSIQAQNNECPLCRATLDASIVQLLAGPRQIPVRQQAFPFPFPVPTAVNQDIPSVEDLVDEALVRDLSDRLASARQAAVESTNSSNSLPLIAASTTLEYNACAPHDVSNIYGLVTVQAPPCLKTADDSSLSVSRVPVDLICVVDQSGSMAGDKMILLKQTLVYIVEQMSELDRVAIVSFDTLAYDRSHGLKRMNQQNQNILKNIINNDIHDAGGTYIGQGLEMGINLFRTRQTKNPVSALLLLTDGQDNQTHDYTQLMQTLPEGVQCHTFGYGPDHTAALLVRLAEQGNGGTFTYIDEEEAVGSAFAITLGGLFTCMAQQVRVNIELSEGYAVTHVHSRYKYEPEQLPSNMITFNLHDLNGDEKRNLIFQLHVPKLDSNEQNMDNLSQQPMILSQTTEELQLSESHTIGIRVNKSGFSSSSIGTVKITYMDPNTGRTVTIDPVPFKLVRDSNSPADLLQVNHTLDLQRNRVETANALERAMAESDYRQSLAILKAQVEKIKASVSAQDPFSQQLIQDLQYNYPSERDYRSSHHNTYMCHTTERGTYVPTTMISSQQYISSMQRQQAAHYYNIHKGSN